jgi:chaperonin GroEL
VVIADQFQPQIVAGLVMNKIKGVLNTIAIESPLHGDKRRAFLNDIAAITGASIVSEETGLSLRDLTIEDFGRADKVISTDDSTLIVGGKGNPSDVQTRIEQIKKEMENPDISDFDREKLQERLAKLTSGIAVINVGASSEVEMREKKERVIDAISAVKAAIEEGIVPGGETTLLRARDALSSELIQANSEERIGIDIVREALTLPFKRLMENSGYDPGESMALVRNAKFGQGIDVIDGELKDLVKAGIIDPVKVVRNIVENAASVSIMCMTTNTIIIEDEERKEQD